MVVSSILLMTMMMAVSGDGGGFSTDLVWYGGFVWLYFSIFLQPPKQEKTKQNQLHL